MAKKLAAAAFQQLWRPSLAYSSSSSSPRFLQSFLTQPENRLSPHEREERPCLQKNQEYAKIHELLFFSSSPPVLLQDLHKSVPHSLPWPKIDHERFPSQERDLLRCSFIDLERIWRLSTNSNYLPAPSEEVQEVILPGQHEDTASPMLMHTKRTFNPSTIVRKRRHGFLARKSTVGGRRVLARRLAKGRRILSA